MVPASQRRRANIIRTPAQAPNAFRDCVPNFLAALSDWDFSPQVPDSAFVFQPPAGVTQVDVKANAQGAPAPAK